jgi:hypothetical protein
MGVGVLLDRRESEDLWSRYALARYSTGGSEDLWSRYALGRCSTGGVRGLVVSIRAGVLDRRKERRQEGSVRGGD